MVLKIERLVRSMLEKYNLLLDREVMQLIDFKERDLFTVLALLFRNQQTMIARFNEGGNRFVASPGGLYGDFFDVTQVSRRQRTKFVESLGRVCSSGLVEVMEINGRPYSKNDKIQWNSLIKFNCTNLVHQSSRTFIMLDTSDMGEIVYQDKVDFQTLLQVYVNVTSYFNQYDISQADTGELDLNYDLYNGNEPHISCYASVDTLCTKRYSTDAKRENWISSKTLTKCLRVLEEIGLLTIVKPNKPKDCKQNFTNHYCYPRHKKLVQRIADNKVKQIIHSQK